MKNEGKFSLDVIDTDKFLDMPASSQILYFHLGVRADNDGFISSPKAIVRAVNCEAADFDTLIKKGFVSLVDNGAYIEAWRWR